MTWSPERVATLKRLLADGLSAEQVAREMGGGLTRNAVIGKKFRLGLCGGARRPSEDLKARNEIIRRRCRAGEKQNAVAADCGLGTAQVSRICSGGNGARR